MIPHCLYAQVLQLGGKCIHLVYPFCEDNSLSFSVLDDANDSLYSCVGPNDKVPSFPYQRLKIQSHLLFPLLSQEIQYIEKGCVDFLQYGIS